MEGRGVTNYDPHKPSYAFSTETTEFDDALMKHNVVTLEQAMMAKGASVEEAHRLANLKRHGNETIPLEEKAVKETARNQNDSDQEGSISDDDEFLQRYRERRLQEIKKKSISRFGEVIPISRDEWMREVNEGSQDAWVVVTLLSSDVERTGCVEEAVGELASKFGQIKFVTIQSKQAIRNWPDEHLPTILLYRNGKLQQQLMQLPVNMTADEVEWQLAEHGVIETTLQEAPGTGRSNKQRSSTGYGGDTTFGGLGAQLATRDVDDDEERDVDY